MSLKHLGRDDAPFGEKVWEYIDRTVVGAAKAELSIRRIIDVEGPYGLGTKSVPRPDRATKLEASLGRAAATVMGSEALGLAGVRSGFVVAPRDVAAFEQTGVAFDAAPVAEAAGACARLEDRLLLEGSSELGVEGLLKAKGALSKKLGSWSEVGAAASDVIAAVTELDRAGMHGPYALALAPALYNLLFRRYRQGQQTEIDHIKRVVTEGVVKAPALEKAPAE